MYGGPESVKCKTSIDLILKTSLTDLPATTAAKTINYFSLIRQVMTIPSQLKPLLDSCIIGFSNEIVLRSLRYVQGYPDMWSFFDTFAYNFGLLYDSVINTMLDLMAKAQKPNLQTSEMYLMLGYGLGNLFYLIFFPE